VLLDHYTISKEEIDKLPTELIKKLYDKLSTKTKGEWKRFAQELEKLDDGL
jgi:Fe-S cluster biosynthesis and repair protein YggX